jgi:hypothetical protein
MPFYNGRCRRRGVAGNLNLALHNVSFRHGTGSAVSFVATWHRAGSRTSKVCETVQKLNLILTGFYKKDSSA